MNFRYAVQGDLVPWRLERAFYDGKQVFIHLPAGIGEGEMPPLLFLQPATVRNWSTTACAATT